MSEYENIPVKPATKERVDKLGHKGETYDEIMSRILSIVEEKRA